MFEGFELFAEAADRRLVLLSEADFDGSMGYFVMLF